MQILILLLIFLCHSSTAKSIELSNDIWQIAIETDSLQLSIEPANSNKTSLNLSLIKDNSKNIKFSDNAVEWQLPKYKLTVSAILKKEDLHIKIISDKTQTIPIFKHIPDLNFQGYIWPLFEGLYIPSNDQIWQETLLSEYAAGNTTQSISLPLVGIEQKEYILNCIFITPFNNKYYWSKIDNKLQLTFEHEFTHLDPYSPLEIIIHLSNNDLLAGAKRYRKSLQNSKKYKSLEQKIIENSNNKKLIGASHIYLWGNTLLSPYDVKKWDSFISYLHLDTIVPNRIKKLLSSKAKKLLKTDKALDENEKLYLISEIDRTINIIGHNINERVIILEELFEDSISKKEQWGDGLSIKMLKRLRKANIKRLWLGFDNWHLGLSHPETINYAKKFGYLIGPYDYINTTKAHISMDSPYLPYVNNRIHKTCRITSKIGEEKVSYNSDTSYMNPTCNESYMRNRIVAIQKSLQANSWFLDEGGSGILHDDYSQKHPMSKKQFAIAINKRFNWLKKHLQVVIGSRNGNSIAAKHLSFAHGMQTPNFAQKDLEMLEQQDSEYYLGNLQPVQAPSIFFNEVPLKDKYIHLYFNPASRIPLYQTVYHDSVITSHHINFDNFKFTNVRKVNTLLHLLYNVPPLYHLNMATIDKRLPTIIKIDKFFRPTHTKLATKALMKIKYLDPDKLTQKITYSDRSILVANFSDQERKYLDNVLPPYSVTAWLSNNKKYQFIAK